MGPSIATRIVLKKPPPADLALVHIDTADRRGLETLGRLDFGNFWQAARIYMALLFTLLFRRVKVVYIPISQTTVGYLRDSILIVMAWLFRRRIILHLRGGNFDEFYEGSGRMMRAFVRWTLRRTHAVIVLGESLRRLFSPFVAPERIHVVPNGADFPELANGTRDYDHDRPLKLYYLGNLLPIKGALDLVRAMPTILARHPGTKLTVSGASPDEAYHAQIEAAVRDLGLADSITFTGKVGREEKTRLLSEADLFVYPSHFEGHPWVIVEALAAGLPIVSCDVGCVAECVLHDQNGRIVPVENPEALAGTVAELLADRTELARMAHASAALYRAGFTEDRFRARLFDVFRAAGRGQAAGEPSRKVRAQASSVSSS